MQCGGRFWQNLAHLQEVLRLLSHAPGLWAVHADGTASSDGQLVQLSTLPQNVTQLCKKYTPALVAVLPLRLIQAYCCLHVQRTEMDKRKHAPLK